MSKINNTQILTTSLGDCSVMKLIQTKLELPKANEVQIKISYTGIAWADVQMRHGTYPKTPKMPFVQGYDLIGKIIDVGANVDKNQIGKTVGAIIQWGAYSKFINIPFEKAIEITKKVDLVKAECLFLNYITAYQLLFRIANVKKNDTILVHGAAGGVGTAILQLAALKDIKAYGTASKGKHKTVIENGGIPIDYKTVDFEKFIKEKEIDGIEAFFDFNAGRIFDKSLSLLKKDGKAMVYNLLEAGSSMPKMLSYFVKFFMKDIFTSKTVKFYSIMGRYKKNPEEYKTDLKHLLNLLEEGKINPIVAKVINLNEVPETHCKFENNEFIGKIIIKID